MGEIRSLNQWKRSETGSAVKEASWLAMAQRDRHAHHDALTGRLDQFYLKCLVQAFHWGSCVLTRDLCCGTSTVGRPLVPEVRSLSGVGFVGVETESRVGAGVGWMWGVGPCGRPRGARAHTPRGTAGSHKGPNPAPRRPCPYALHLIMAQNLPLREVRSLIPNFVQTRVRAGHEEKECRPQRPGCDQEGSTVGLMTGQVYAYLRMERRW